MLSPLTAELILGASVRPDATAGTGVKDEIR